MTQFQLFLVILWTLWFIKPKFRKTRNVFKDITDTWDGFGGCLLAGLIILAIGMFFCWFQWTIAGILLPYVNYYLPGN